MLVVSPGTVEVEPSVTVVVGATLVEVVDVEGSGSTGSSGSVTTVVEAGTVVEVGSIGSKGSTTVVVGNAGPTVVTEPDVDPSVAGDASERLGSAVGDVVLGVLAVDAGSE